mmetsp:Transcript_48384/g.89084  ORF Transcript_48384/g.89084 Transcript_48384/m.89084 type:complete len:1023 (+) Transcript_48384:72-3140(+)
MLQLAPAALALAFALGTTKDAISFFNSLFSSGVAVTGDAHQAKVAQDLFRQEVRYERSLQMREDVRDMEKLMVEGVQAHTFMDSIILGVCFAMLIEGHPPEEADRTLVALWLVFATWSVAFTLVGLLLALRFQTKVSTRAQQRLLKRNRFTLPDDLVVGNLGGKTIFNQVAAMHRVLHQAGTSFVDKVSNAIPVGESLPVANGKDVETGFKVSIPSSSEPQPDEGVPMNSNQQSKVTGEQRLPGKVAAGELSIREDGPMGKEVGVTIKRNELTSIRAWSHFGASFKARGTLGSGVTHCLRDIPFFLLDEKLVPQPYFSDCDSSPLKLWINGKATLYIAGLCPPPKGTASWISTQVQRWPKDQLPVVTQGNGHIRRGSDEWDPIDGFTIFVDPNKDGDVNLELPVYKMVLDYPGDDEYVDVHITWKFKSEGCAALLVFLRKGEVACNEEDWPIEEFQQEVAQVTPLRDFSSFYMRHGISCLCLAAGCMVITRLSVIMEASWWFETVLVIVASLPALLLLMLLPLQKDELIKRVVLETVSCCRRRRRQLHERKPCKSVVASTQERLPVEKDLEAEADGQDAHAMDHDKARAAHEALALPLTMRNGASALSTAAAGAARGLFSKCDGCCSQAVDHCELRVQPGSEVHVRPEACDNQRVPSKETDAAAHGPSGPSDQVQAKDEPIQHSPSKRSGWARSKAAAKQLPITSQLLVGWLSLEVLFIISLLAATLIPWLFLEQETDGAAVTSAEATSGGFGKAIAGQTWSVTWPPFFQPSAAAVELDSASSLLISAGSLLRVFQESSSEWRTNSSVSILDEPAIGFGYFGSRLHVVGATGVREVLSRAAGDVDATGLLADLSQAQPVVSGALYLLPVEHATHVALFDMALFEDSPVLPAAAVASGGSIHLCASLSGTVEGNGTGQLEILATLSTYRSGAPRALHVCRKGWCSSDEPVLWVADAGGSIAAFGASSGMLLGSFALPYGNESSVTALTGNSSHMIIVAAGADGAFVWSTQYPELRNDLVIAEL